MTKSNWNHYCLCSPILLSSTTARTSVPAMVAALRLLQMVLRQCEKTHTAGVGLCTVVDQGRTANSERAEWGKGREHGRSRLGWHQAWATWARHYPPVALLLLLRGHKCHELCAGRAGGDREAPCLSQRWAASTEFGPLARRFSWTAACVAWGHDWGSRGGSSCWTFPRVEPWLPPQLLSAKGGPRHTCSFSNQVALLASNSYKSIAS